MMLARAGEGVLLPFHCRRLRFLSWRRDATATVWVFSPATARGLRSPPPDCVGSEARLTPQMDEFGDKVPVTGAPHTEDDDGESVKRTPVSAQQTVAGLGG
ncbi:hypothetical protein HYQ46_006520 [Verticillium longisporum]|nr:hypothetical protein HYQ46_006520 [Verticillium longisporum]